MDRFLATEPSAAVDSQGSKKNILCTNAFDVPRSELISALSDLKGAFFKELQIISIAELITPTSDPLSLSQPKSTQSIARMANMRLEALTDSDDLHSLPVADMGIYQERMQKIQQENLRDPFRDEESVKSLQKTMFGNPYKQDKKVSIDEEDEVPAADTSVSSNSTSSGSSWSSIFGRKRKPRRRSVSPSHFPIEKIPSLAKGDGSMSGREQSLSIGPPNARATLPLLRIVIHDGSGKTRMAEDMTERHVVMHDGEDDGDDEDEYRRAVFNSDEMELDNGDEAARLRADTPMPGGIGLDDDDQDMEDMHRAQDMIPPPLVEISRDDIVNDGTTSTLKGKETTSTELMQVAEYDKHRQGMQEDLDHLNGAVNPVFESLVYDPTALMELQSIPPVIPEQKPFDGIAPTFSNGSNMYSSPQSSDGDDSDNHPSLVGRDAGGSDIPQNLMPIPLLLPLPAEITTNPVDPIQSALTLGVSTEPSLQKSHGLSIVANGKSDDKSLRDLAEGATVPCNLQQTLTTVKPPLSEGHPILTESPQEFRNMMIKHMKMDPRSKHNALYLQLQVASLY